MSKLNKIILLGTLENTPELKATNEGDTFANFKLNVQRPQQENLPQKSDLFTIVCWRETAEKIKDSNQGDTLLVQGSIKNRNFENNEGIRIYVTEIDAREIIKVSNQTSSSSTNDHIPILEEMQSETNQTTNFDFNDAIKIEEPAVELGENIPF